MNLQEEIEAARALCISAHAGQFRRDGVTPYHTHPMAVADAVPDELKPAALLHDVLEDTHIEPEALRMYFSDRTCNAVAALTKKSRMHYDYYMTNVLYSPDAVKIKIADMEHNLKDNPTNHARRCYSYWLPVLKRKDEEYESHTKTTNRI